MLSVQLLDGAGIGDDAVENVGEAASRKVQNMDAMDRANLLNQDIGGFLSVPVKAGRRIGNLGPIQIEKFFAKTGWLPMRVMETNWTGTLAPRRRNLSSC